jgi:hypothetical protein
MPKKVTSNVRIIMIVRRSIVFVNGLQKTLSLEVWQNMFERPIIVASF